MYSPCLDCARKDNELTTLRAKCEGLTLQSKGDGHWVFVKHGGKHGGFNVENTLRGLTRAAFVAWIDATLADDEGEDD